MFIKSALTSILAAVVLLAGRIAPAAGDEQPNKREVILAAAEGRVKNLRSLFEQSRPSAELLDAALFAAIRANEVPSLDYLIDQGALPNGLDKSLEGGPLSAAVGAGSKEASEALVKHGAKPTLPAHWAGLGLDAELAAYLDQHPQALEDLRHEETQRNPLHVAAANGRIATVDLLLKRGLSVNLADAWNMTPLHEAVLHSRTEMVKHLLANKAEANVRMRPIFVAGLPAEPHTPLHLAIGVNHPEIAAILLDAGANLDEPPFTLERMLRDAAGHDGRKMAQNGREMVNVLIAKTDERQRARLLASAVKAHDGLVLEALLAQGVDVAPALGIPPIHWALLHAQPRLALMFIENEADVREVYDVGTPLARAAERGYDEIVARLLERKADVDFGTTTGSTPLQFAVEKGDVRCVKLLLAAGANVQRVSAARRAALEKSKDANEKAIAALLRQNDAK